MRRLISILASVMWLVGSQASAASPAPAPAQAQDPGDAAIAAVRALDPQFVDLPRETDYTGGQSEGVPPVALDSYPGESWMGIVRLTPPQGYQSIAAMLAAMRSDTGTRQVEVVLVADCAQSPVDRLGMDPGSGIQCSSRQMWMYQVLSTGQVTLLYTNSG